MGGDSRGWEEIPLEEGRKGKEREEGKEREGEGYIHASP